METLSNHIGGSPRPPAGGAYLDNIEPATGQVIARVPASTSADVNDAVDAASHAFEAWSQTPAAERSRLLLRLADRIDAQADALAHAESIDTGKPISLARRVDIPRSAANLRFFATAILHDRDEAYRTEAVGPQGARAVSYTVRRPRGVAGAITPWNLPLYLMTWKIAPALASGCTVVAKPSELTPTTAGMLASLASEAGLPAGVLNVVHGAGPEAGAALVTHPRVPSITFTGSTRTGAWMAQHAGPMFKRLSLELGGKNALIIFDDAPLDGPESAVALAARSAFTNQGQVCLCGSRVLAHRRVFDSVVAGLVHAARTLRVGDPLDPETEFGSLISRQHKEKIRGYVELARDLGGFVLCGGESPHEVSPRCRDGAFFLPTVITGLDPHCRVEQEEIFGPVVTVTPFETEAEALALANGTRYGLSATVLTRDVSRAHRVAERLEAGVVWVNCWMVRDLRTPFGGMKESGIGREGGEEALRFFAEPSSVTIAL